MSLFARRSARLLLVVTAAAGAAAGAACLSPQPLPPDDRNASVDGPGGETGKGSSSGFAEEPNADPATPSGAMDAGTTGPGDGGLTAPTDGGDAGRDGG